MTNPILKIAPKVRYVACNQWVQGSEGSCFSTNQTKVQILDYGQTTRKVNVSGQLSPHLPNEREEGPPDRRLRFSCTYLTKRERKTHQKHCLLPWLNQTSVLCGEVFSGISRGVVPPGSPSLDPISN